MIRDEDLSPSMRPPISEPDPPEIVAIKRPDGWAAWWSDDRRQSTTGHRTRASARRALRKLHPREVGE